MKNISRLLLIHTLLFICLSCEAKSNPSHSSQNHSIVSSNINLNCQNVELDDDKLICEYWQKHNQFNQPINLSQFKKAYGVNEINELSPMDYAYYASGDVEYMGKNYQVLIYPNSWIRLRRAKETHDFICQNQQCKGLFLWEFVNEAIGGEHSELDEKAQKQRNDLLNQLHPAENITQAKTTNKQMVVKIYFDTQNEHMKPYVIRQVSATSPLRQALQAYLKGITPDEYKQGYRNNTLGITQIKSVNIHNQTADIHFSIDDLQISSPSQVIDFTFNITQIAEQFPNVKSVDICINGISNYQMAFFANVEGVPRGF